MAINVYLSGTTGATDGTLDVQGDGIGLSLSALNAVAVAHLRCPSGDVNADGIVITAPTDCHASTDGSTYGATAAYAAGEVGDTNTPIYIKRVTDSGNTEPLALFVAITGLANTVLAPAAPVLGTITVSDVTSTAAVVTFSATDANDDPLTYRVAVTTSETPPSDWSGYSDTTSPYSATWLTAETAHYAHVRASDGTLYDVGTSAQFTTLAASDITAPAIAGTLTATPTATQGQVTLAGPTATDDVGIAKWQYQVDGGAWVDVASTSGTFPSTNVSGLDIGSRSFAVRCLDAANNPSATRTASATVADLTAPTISGTLVATAGDTQVTLTGPTATDNVGIAKWQYQVDGGAWVDVASTASTFPSTVVSGLSNGTAYTFGVRVVDTSTNPSSVLTADATPLAPGLNRLSTGKIAYGKFASGLDGFVDIYGAGTDDINVSNYPGELMVRQSVSPAQAGTAAFTPAAEEDTTNYLTGKFTRMTTDAEGKINFLQQTPLYYSGINIATNGAHISLVQNDVMIGTVFYRTTGTTQHTFAVKQVNTALTAYYDGAILGSRTAPNSMSSIKRIQLYGGGATAGSSGMRYDDIAWHESHLITCAVPSTGSYKLRVRDAATTVSRLGLSADSSITVDITGVEKVLDVVELLDANDGDAVLATLTLTDDVFGGDAYAYA